MVPLEKAQEKIAGTLREQKRDALLQQRQQDARKKLGPAAPPK